MQARTLKSLFSFQHQQTCPQPVSEWQSMPAPSLQSGRPQSTAAVAYGRAMPCVMQTCSASTQDAPEPLACICCLALPSITCCTQQAKPALSALLCWTLGALVQDVLGRTTLDALIAAGDLGLGVHAQNWQHCQFLDDLDYCSVAASACAARLLAKHLVPGCMPQRPWPGVPSRGDARLHVAASPARGAMGDDGALWLYVAACQGFSCQVAPTVDHGWLLGLQNEMVSVG